MQQFILNSGLVSLKVLVVNSIAFLVFKKQQTVIL